MMIKTRQEPRIMVCFIEFVWDGSRSLVSKAKISHSDFKGRMLFN